MIDFYYFDIWIGAAFATEDIAARRRTLAALYHIDADEVVAVARVAVNT